MRTDPSLVAARLGIDVDYVRRLQARGYLHRLDLTDEEVRERLYRAHVAAAPAARRTARDERRR